MFGEGGLSAVGVKSSGSRERELDRLCVSRNASHERAQGRVYTQGCPESICTGSRRLVTQFSGTGLHSAVIWSPGATHTHCVCVVEKGQRAASCPSLPSSVLGDITSGAGNQPPWEYLHHVHGQALQTRLCPLENWFVKHLPASTMCPTGCTHRAGKAEKTRRVT